MRYIVSIFVLGMFLLTAETTAQNIFNIFPEPGAGNAGVGTGPLPLNLMHLHGTGDNLGPQPVLRFSFGDLNNNGQPFVTEFQPIAQLALPRTNANALTFSQQAIQGDFVIRTTQNSGRLILSTQKPGQPILFTTSITSTTPVVPAIDYTLVSISNGTEMPARSPTLDPPLGSINGRMTTSRGVHLGVECADPKDAVQVGSRLTLHPGYNFNYVGYNQSTNSSFQLIRLTGTVDATDNPSATPPVESGHAAGLAFMRSGEAILYSAGENGAGTPVQIWQEPEWFYRGITVAPDGLVGVGLMAPKPTSSPVNVATSRLTIRGPLGQKHSYGSGTSNTFSMGERASLYSLRVMTGDGFEILNTREDRRVGIGTMEPRELLQVGNLMTFHDGGGKFVGFNSFWDAVTGQMKNIEASRVSATIGIGVGSTAPFTIRVDQKSSVGQIMNAEFKGFAITSSGNMGVGTDEANARLVVQGAGTTSATTALRVVNSASVEMLRIRNDGKVLIGAETVTTGDHTNFKLSVDGKIVSRSYVATETGWADDVFEEGYNLLDLKELESYIDANGHLPGVPTKDDVSTNGVDLSATMVLLLRKVEELTLYVIELKKENVLLREASHK